MSGPRSEAHLLKAANPAALFPNCRCSLLAEQYASNAALDTSIPIKFCMVIPHLVLSCGPAAQVSVQVRRQRGGTSRDLSFRKTLPVSGPDSASVHHDPEGYDPSPAITPICAFGVMAPIMQRELFKS